MFRRRVKGQRETKTEKRMGRLHEQVSKSNNFPRIYYAPDTMLGVQRLAVNKTQGTHTAEVVQSHSRAPTAHLARTELFVCYLPWLQRKGMKQEVGDSNEAALKTETEVEIGEGLLDSALPIEPNFLHLNSLQTTLSNQMGFQKTQPSKGKCS